jgi:ferredoxin
MQAFVDAEVCTSCGLCIDICPEVFEMGDDAAVVKTDPVPPDAEERCLEARDSCPVEAIRVED